MDILGFTAYLTVKFYQRFLKAKLGVHMPSPPPPQQENKVVLAGGQHHHVGWQRLRGRQGGGNLYGDKREAPGVPGVGPGGRREEPGILSD